MVDSAEGDINKTKDLISVVVRFHDPEKLPQLDEALFSLSCQTYSKIQVILVVQRNTQMDESFLNALKLLIAKQPFEDPAIHKAAYVDIPNGMDGRSELLNQGIKLADGQYLAFLDYDDVVYNQSYELLIDRIRDSKFPVAVGGCILATQERITDDANREHPTNNYDGNPGHLYTVSKRPYLEPGSAKTKLDLIAANFIPIHTFVLDRTQIDPTLLKFNTSLKCYEDYEVLLKLASKYEFDFKLLDTPLVEYRIRNDGSNTIPTHEASPQVRQQWEESKRYIENLKTNMMIQVNAKDLSDLVKSHDRLAAERKTLTFQIAAIWYSLTEAWTPIKKLKRLGFSGIAFTAKKLRSIRIFFFRCVRYND